MKNLTLDEIKRAFSLMGEFLRDKKTLGEIAVYGGGAILLQFRWRSSTRDVDATVISDGNHGLVRQAADQAAAMLGLERSWLSEAVSHYTSVDANTSGLTFSGREREKWDPGSSPIGVEISVFRRPGLDPGSGYSVGSVAN